MKQLIAATEDFIKQERSKLNADASAGSNVTLTLLNNDSLADNDFLVVGVEGSEKAELVQINAAVVAGTAVQVATLKFAHKAGEPITKYRYNKRKFYGATASGGSYTELTADGSPVEIQVDDPQGTLLEYTGNEGYLYFKSTYYNSEDATETDIDDAEEVEADETKRYTSIYNIRKHAGLTENPYISDGRIETKRKQAESEVKASIGTRYALPLSEIPGVVQYITTLLAAGYIDFEEFGGDGQGVKWLGEARGMLKSIKEGRVALFGTDDTELTRQSNSGTLIGKPDGTETGDELVKFKISTRF